MMIRHVLLIAAGSAVLAACSSPQGNLPPIQKMEQTVYRLGAGDEVRISVFGLDALTTPYVVGDAGTISLPLVAEIPARETGRASCRESVFQYVSIQVVAVSLKK